MKNQRIFGITGWKNSGKTTLVERLVKELVARKWTVSTVKHAHHDFDIDQQGTDSFRHRQAGAGEVAIVSPRRWALMHELAGKPEPALDEILTHLAPCDIVLVEGYKNEPHLKIEVRRREAREHSHLSLRDSRIIAVACDYPQPDETLPVFDIDDIKALADFIEFSTKLGS
ncbi:molybdopterin-guanine dinucleotide biosynthesis protein B [Aquamicrobium segne]|uniref:Molybdopterin-guanine dinucleotide biosynthesis protein B n=1 Tax=Aquamicrobium segne TaxID=469547 RepID=A0ABW0GX74_9HYPH